MSIVKNKSGLSFRGKDAQRLMAQLQAVEERLRPLPLAVAVRWVCANWAGLNRAYPLDMAG